MNVVRLHSSGPMPADHFVWVPLMVGDKCSMRVTHKFTKREWYREFNEADWPAVRVELLEAIEADLLTPNQEAPKA